MGALFRFACPDCGYAAEVSGGLDVGMMSVTHIVCRWRPLRSVDVAGRVTPSARKRCSTTVKTTSDLP